jgi:1-phosphofructokinase
MKIVTVTLNPAIDQTVRIDNLKTNSVNRGQSMQFDAGGKGVNVASYLADYGYETAALSVNEVAVTGFLGQENTAIFESLFARKKITDHFIRIPGRTRTNVKIVDEANQETTDINMKGESPSSEAVHDLITKIEELVQEYDWFVLAGNLPPQVPTSIYAALISRIRERGKWVALDTSRKALQEGVLAQPTVIKPNIHELAQLVGHELVGETAVIHAAHQLLDQGIQLVVVSMGEEGALFIDREQTIKAIPPTVQVKSTVGAGDAMVAGLVAGHIQGLPLAECARLATAFSLGGITRVGAHLPDSDTLQSFINQVSIETLESMALTTEVE